MSAIASVLARILWVLVIVVFTVVRVALAAVLGLIAPLLLPLLVLLSGGSLVITGAFALTRHWHQVLMAGWACFLCTAMLVVFAGVMDLVNPYAFTVPVRVTNPGRE